MLGRKQARLSNVLHVNEIELESGVGRQAPVQHHLQKRHRRRQPEAVRPDHRPREHGYHRQAFPMAQVQRKALRIDFGPVVDVAAVGIPTGFGDRRMDVIGRGKGADMDDAAHASTDRRFHHVARPLQVGQIDVALGPGRPVLEDSSRLVEHIHALQCGKQRLRLQEVKLHQFARHAFEGRAAPPVANARPNLVSQRTQRADQVVSQVSGCAGDEHFLACHRPTLRERSCRRR